MKNHSVASDRSPSPCQVEKIKFYSNSNDSEADLSARDCRGRRGPACRAVPEVCPGEWRLQVQSPWPRPDQHGSGWQLPAHSWCFWSEHRSAGCHLFCCPTLGCSVGMRMLLPRWICLQTQGSVRQQPGSPRPNPAVPDGSGTGGAAWGALACIASAQHSLGQADEIINL